MRILEIQFKNLNSLAGEWTLDLTHPAFTADSIFAITGPTGAGKTTILDAVCLALYGRTPRLKTLSKSENEIMARQTGECFAAVRFATPAGEFRCQWSQHRARKKASGDLQNPKHEIAAFSAGASEGRVLESKILGVAKKVEELTGMDFDRFTRSILLAQGGFAAFLQASPDQRSPLLEELTGTELYSDISRRVHERRSAERTALNTLEAELAGVRLLDPDAERELQEELARCLDMELQLAQHRTTHEQTLAWLNTVAALAQEAARLSACQEALEQRVQAFLPERQRLERAERALELGGEHARLIALRESCEEGQRQHTACLHALQLQEQRCGDAERGLEQAHKNLARTRLEQQTTEELLRKVRELDLRIDEKNVPLTALQREVTDKQRLLLNTERIRHEHAAQLERKKAEMLSLTRELERTAADKGLAEQLARLRERFDALEEMTRTHQEKEQAHTTARTQEQASLQTWTHVHGQHQACQTALDASRRALHEQEQRARARLGERELSAWRADFMVEHQHKIVLDTLCEDARHWHEIESTWRDLLRRQAEHQARLPELESRIFGVRKELEHTERERDLLQTILALTEHRNALRQGEPCPLCGSTTHPLMETASPEGLADNTDVSLSRTTDTLKALREQLESLSTARTAALTEQQWLETRRTECVAVKNACLARLREGIQSLPGDTASLAAFLSEDGQAENLLTCLHHLRDESAATLETINTLLQQAEQDATALTQSRAQLATFEEEYAKLGQLAQEAAHQKELAAQTCLRLDSERTEQAARLLERQREILLLLAPYGITALPPPPFTDIHRDLVQRKEQYLLRQSLQETGLRETETLQERLRHLEEQYLEASRVLQDKEQTLTLLRAEQTRLRTDRGLLFGDKLPDEEAARVTAATQQSEAAFETARLQLETCRREQAALQRSLENNTATLERHRAERQASESTFCQHLATTGFGDEATYKQACLPETTRRALAEQATALVTEQAELAALRADNTQRLREEKEKKLVDAPREQVEAALLDLNNKYKEQHEAIGGLRQRLHDNELAKAQQRHRLTAIEAQKRECARWNTLHELIGSADGKKYRNYAQGLTFEIMIGHANRQLRQMSDRYLLLKSSTQPLELDVMDSYQAGEIRSTKNLSGGESFLVSLALALGLSHMASQNVRVDSLFLDEGFGTLDGDALETALETLSNLRESGKLIGIISHVEALKERIPTQIRVTPRTGGLSEISGPGCRKTG